MELEKRLTPEGERKLKVIHEKRVELYVAFPGQSSLPPDQQHPLFISLRSALNHQERLIRIDYSLPVRPNGNGKVDPQELS